jgi:prepilin peptidase CpaA
MSELQAFFELAGMLATDPRTVVLFTLLITAAWIDVNRNRIPNWLTVSGLVFALGYSAFVPFYLKHGFLWSLGGAAIGFGLLFPMWLLRILGAGDVKLMAMVGAFLGLQGTIWALLFSGAAGGIAAVAFALRKRMLARMFANTGDVLRGMLYSAVAGNGAQLRPAQLQSVGRLAYGISIAAGSAAYVVANQFGLI